MRIVLINTLMVLIVILIVILIVFVMFPKIVATRSFFRPKIHYPVVHRRKLGSFPPKKELVNLRCRDSTKNVKSFLVFLGPFRREAIFIYIYIYIFQDNGKKIMNRKDV